MTRKQTEMLASLWLSYRWAFSRFLS